jgi:UDP-galactopyranose mutase
MPICLQTLHAIYGVTAPAEARALLRSFAFAGDTESLEAWALSLVGPVIYELLVRHYTEKQWARPCAELPAAILRRIPVRLTWDDRYFSDAFQGVPRWGYTTLFGRMLDGAAVELGVDYFEDRDRLDACAKRVVYSGPIDRYFDYAGGRLEYRSLRFAIEHRTGDFQGCTVMNHTGPEVPYTRTHEWKHFEGLDVPHTIVSIEYPTTDGEPYYPVPTQANEQAARAYAESARIETAAGRVVFGGRLGTYRYYDMHQVIAQGLKVAREVRW